jgi:hypothetical protein
MPGFTAGAALSSTHDGYYVGIRASEGADASIEPAQFRLMDILSEPIRFWRRCWIIGEHCKTVIDHSTRREVTLCLPIRWCSPEQRR